MPTYDYKCESCEAAWSRYLKIAECNLPCEQPCPKCEEENTVRKVLHATPLSYRAGVHDNTKKMSSDFKTVMSQIKKGHPRCNIPDY